jgi:hypothetical protein
LNTLLSRVVVAVVLSEAVVAVQVDSVLVPDLR